MTSSTEIRVGRGNRGEVLEQRSEDGTHHNKQFIIFPGSSMDRLRRNQSVSGDDEPQAVSPLDLMLREIAKPGGMEQLKEWTDAIKAKSTPDLLLDVSVTGNPIRLWLLHVALDARDVPPCLRTTREATHEMFYLTWLADVLWFAKRLKNHKVVGKQHRKLFQCATPARDRKWHQAALFAFDNGHANNGFLARRFGFLGLPSRTREQGAVFKSPSMTAQRTILSALPEYRERIVAHLLNHPDKAGRHTAESIADRRIKMLRCYVLSGKSATIGNRYFQMITGEAITRQVFERQIETTYDIVR